MKSARCEILKLEELFSSQNVKNSRFSILLLTSNYGVGVSVVGRKDPNLIDVPSPMGKRAAVGVGWIGGVATFLFLSPIRSAPIANIINAVKTIAKETARCWDKILLDTGNKSLLYLARKDNIKLTEVVV